MEYMILPLRRYADFQGRSRRMEYWMFFLFNILVGIGFGVVTAMLGGGMAAMGNPTASAAAGGAIGIVALINVIFSLAMLIPSIAVAVRRLHDLGRTGWWLLAPVGFYLIGFVVMLGSGLSALTAGTSGSLGMGVGLVAGGVLLMVGAVLALVLLVFFFMEGTRGPNRFGPDPKDPAGDLGDVFR